MTLSHKPLWIEGISLAQQHFQQWDAYWQNQLNSYYQQVAPYTWGVQQLNIDTQALLIGELRIKYLVAVFESGEMVVVDDEVGMPLNFQFSDQEKSSIVIYLCIAKQNTASGISGYDDAVNIPKYFAEYKNLRDCYDSERQREVLLGRANAFLAEAPDTRYYNTLPLLKLSAQADGSLQLDDAFIPPAGCLSASSALINMLDTMQSAISVCQHQVDYPLSGLLMQAVVELNFYRSNPCCTIWQFYLCIAKLIANISVYQRSDAVRIPDYRHENVGKIMWRLNDLLQVVLKKCSVQQQPVVRLNRIEPTLFVVDNLDASFLNNDKLYLTLKTTAMGSWQRDDFIRSVKIGSQKNIQQLMSSALQGVVIKPLGEVLHYQLDITCSDWKAVVVDQSLAIFIPEVFAVQQVELVSADSMQSDE